MDRRAILWGSVFVAVVLCALLTLADRPGAVSDGRPALELPADDDARRRLIDASALDRVLDDLVLEERYVEAFDVAAGQLTVRSDLLGPRHPDSLASLHRMGTIAHLGGDQQTAEELLQMAVDRRREVLGERHRDLADSLYRRGLVARYRDERPVAWDCYREALDLLDSYRTEDLPLIGAILQAQASWLREKGHDVAASRYEDALAVRRRALDPPHLDLADNLTWLGWTLAYAGRHDEALPYLREAEAQLRALGLEGHSLMGVITNLGADRAALRGDWSEAEKLYERTSEIYEGARRKYLPGFARRKMPLDGYTSLALSRIHLGQPTRAWHDHQRASGALNLDFLSLARWSRLSPENYQKVEALRRDYLKARDDLGRLRADASSTTTTVSDREWAVTLRKLQLRAAINNLEHRFLLEHRLPSADLATLQAALPQGTAYMGRLDVRLGALRSIDSAVLNSMWTYVVRPTGPVQWIPIWESRSPEDYRRLRRLIDRSIKMTHRAAEWPLRVEPDDMLLSIHRELNAILVQPVLPQLEGIDTLIVEAPNHLDFITPLLGAKMGERFLKAYVPSAAAYILVSEPARQSREVAMNRVLAVGDPAFGENDDLPDLDTGAVKGRLARLDLDRVRHRGPTTVSQLPRLPHSGIEARRVSALFPDSTLLLGADATERQLHELATSGRLSRFDVLHVATHSLIDAMPERCAFAFAPSAGDDGLVDVEDILYTWKLDAELMTLSGCQTTRGAGFTRGEFVGFTQVLLAAGARSLVMSYWNVDDWATSELMQRFYENLTGRYTDVRAGRSGVPMSKALALNEAKNWLRDYVAEDGTRPFQHPLYWSGFILVGSPI